MLTNLAKPLLVITAIGALCWWLTISMSVDFYAALAAGKTDMWADASLGMLLLMWGVMMAAMMLPSFVSTILAYANLLAKKQKSAGANLYVFLGGYGVVWFGFSAIATLLQFGLAEVLTAQLSLADPLLRGGLLLAAGGYQFSRLKFACLKRCRHPVFFFLMHWRSGAAGAFRMGVENGLWCLGCCLLLMLLLFIGGIMDLRWIVFLTLVVLVEKVLPVSPKLTAKGVGALLVAFGCVELFHW